MTSNITLIVVYIECHVFDIDMLSNIMLSVAMLSVVILSAVMLIAIKLNVVAPEKMCKLLLGTFIKNNNYIK
jgi:hypothetical protein